MSAWIPASAMPGYCTLTATSRPSRAQRGAVDLTDRGGDRPARSRRRHGRAARRGPPRSSLPIARKETVGAASRSFASSRWNSSRCSSGTRPTSRKRHHLPELHRGALHRAEHRDDLLGRLDLPPRERGVGGIVSTHQVLRRRGCRTGVRPAPPRSLLIVADRTTREVGMFSSSRAITAHATSAER